LKLNRLENLKKVFLIVLVNIMLFSFSYGQGQIFNSSGSILSINGVVSFHGDLTVANGNDFVSYATTRALAKGNITITNDKGRLSKEDIERMVEEAEKHAADDKLRMERVESKNQLESYLYNTRNAVREDKVKETLGESTVSEVEGWIKEGIDWLEANPEAEKEEYDEKQKMYEDKIKPVMMKLYEKSGAPGSTTDGMPDISGMNMGGEAGPRVDEVD
jgi:L1 cell adhesion molecule like protein